MRDRIGQFGRIAFWLVFVGVIGDAVITLWALGNHPYAILALVLFPLTFIVWPVATGWWWIPVVALAGYWAATHISRPPPVEALLSEGGPVDSSSPELRTYPGTNYPAGKEADLNAGSASDPAVADQADGEGAVT